MEEIRSGNSLLPSENYESSQSQSQTQSQYSAVPVELSDSEDYDYDDSINSLPDGTKDKSISYPRIFLRILCFLLFILFVVLAASFISYVLHARPTVNGIEPSIRRNLLQNQQPNSNSLLFNPPELISEPLSTENHKKLYQFEDTYSGAFRARSPSLKWVVTDSDVDGKYSYEDGVTGQIRISHADTKWSGKNEYTVLIDRATIDKYEPEEPFSEYILSPDLKYIAVLNHYEKVWRHSYTAQYRIFDLNDISKPPITVSPKQGQNIANQTHYISLFQWSKKGHDVSFVLHNNVYVLTNDFKTTIQVTKNGGPEIINGIPDWVYEEEVYAGNSATWWSPNGNYIAYLSFDDRPVPEVQVPLYSNGAILSHANLIAPSNIPLTPAPPSDLKDFSKFLSSYADYPQYVKFKYPKSGYSNPFVTLNVFQVKHDHGKYISSSDMLKKKHKSRRVRMNFNYILSKRDPYLLELSKAMNSDSRNQIISDVVWDLQSDSLIVRFTNKAQDIIATSIVNFENSTQKALEGKVVRLEPGGFDFSSQGNNKGDGGWYQTDSHPILPVPNINKFHGDSNKATGYVDRVVVDGYYHLVLFSSLDSTTPSHLLTQGPYDVDSSIGFDTINGRLYYSSREMDSTASHIFSVDLKGNNKIHISNESGAVASTLNSYYPGAVDDSKSKLDRLGHFEGEISPMGGYLLLSYTGPYVPYHILVKSSDYDKAAVLEKNSALRERLNQYDIPLPRFSRVVVNGTELNTLELRPPASLDNKSKKLRVLFRCYGGPESQLVSRKFRLDFHTWLVSNLTDVAVVIVDGRGTGFKGRKFAVGITGNLGEQEAQDQLGAIREYSKYGWVDSKHLGLWGWSYGGYLTAKSVEADDGGLLSAAISVAPVSDWRFYDSIYTERYMKTPQSNPSGFTRAAVNRVSNFNHTNYLLMHGAADDNVHVENSMRLIDLFNNAKITRPVFFTLPDNDHGINAYYSNRALYTRLYEHVRDRL